MQCIMRLRVPQNISEEASYKLKNQRGFLMVVRLRNKIITIKQAAEFTPQEMSRIYSLTKFSRLNL